MGWVVVAWIGCMLMDYTTGSAAALEQNLEQKVEDIGYRIVGKEEPPSGFPERGVLARQYWFAG